jgi:hypothetical protein
VVPLDSTAYHRAYFKEGSGLYGPKLSTDVDGSFDELTVMFHTLAMDFVDQSGDLTGTGDERVYIDNICYKADGATAVVPLDSTVYHRAYFKEGSGLYGPKLSTDVDGSFDELTVMFHTLAMDFEDQSGDLAGTGDERVYIDNVGYKAIGDIAVVPLDSTVYHRAYFKEGSGLYGPKLSADVDGSTDILNVSFRQISFAVIYGVTGDPVSGAEVYVDNVGYIENGGTVIVPLGSTVYHKAKVDSTWSDKTGKAVDETWTQCTYEWDGVDFSPSSYE